MSDCARYGAAVRNGAPIRMLAQLRGRCREQQFVRNLCLGRVARDARGRVQRVPRAQWPQPSTQLPGADIRRGVRVSPMHRRSPVIDAVLGPLGPRGAPRAPGAQPGLEHKALWARHYVNPTTGRVDRQALSNRVLHEANQVRRHQQWSARRAGVRPGMPLVHELVYTLDGLAGLPAASQRSVRSLIQQTAQRAGVRAHVLNLDA
jgi:hypothetical protein